MSWSLRRRFLLITVISSAIALLAAGSFLRFLYEHDLRDRVHAEIHTYLMELIGGLDIGADGRVRATQALADPRFHQPLSGLYWEVDSATGQVLVSRSLWDATLQKSAPDWKDIEDPVAVAGPFGEPVLLHARLIALGDGPARQQLRVMIAIDETEVREPSRRFAVRLAVSLAILALVMCLVSAAQLAVVMEPLNRLRGALRRVRDGTSSRVEGAYPSEMEPVVDRLNALLLHKEQTVEQARSRASNFAHGLKTPLTIIDTLVSDLREQGHDALAAGIGSQTGRIKSHVDRELARARMASGHGEPLQDAGAVLREVINTIKQLPRSEAIVFSLEAPPGLALLMDREDLIELSGNLLDNARKWASSRVVTRLARVNGDVVLTVSDDGPGIAEQDRTRIAERGRRLDEATEGTGIGLAIVKDMADAYHLRVSLETSEMGGLAVSVVFPQQRAP